MHKEYAHALYQAIIKEGADTQKVFDTFIARLKREGKMKALPMIKSELIRIYTSKQSSTPTLFVASENDIEKYKQEVPASNDTPKIRVESNIIGGWIYTDTNKIIDASYRGSLISLYKKIVNK